MKPRFQPDADQLAHAAAPVDLEPYDAGEQRFAASREAAPPTRPRFVVEEPGAATPSASAEKGTGAISREPANGDTPVAPCSGAVSTDPVEQEEPDSWREEVAARVSTYRARRRPRAPRYPSLRLKFEPFGGSVSDREPSLTALTAPVVTMDEDNAAPVSQVRRETEPVAAVEPAPVPEPVPAKIIEFPRSAATPPRVLEELAEPILDRPRILEAPEVAPPPPALGGILIEPAEAPANEKQPGFEIPLRPATMSRRLLATLTDGLLVASAFALFSYIVVRIAGVPPLPQAAATTIALAVLFWASYQYLLLVCAGTTPGLKLARLRLSCFDDTPVPRRLRRWRVLLSVLSGASLALGYAWCFFDEDQLCWHDRMTRTYTAPAPPAKPDERK